MNAKMIWGVICFCLCLIPGVGAVEKEKLDAKELAFFEKKIRPVLVEKCYKCHSTEADKIKGGLLLDTRQGIRQGGDNGPSVVPGDVKESLLIAAIKYEDSDMEMPPKERLPESVVNDFVRWIEMGAPDPRKADADAIAATRSEIDFEKGREFWAFNPPTAVKVPGTKNADWPRNEIDSHVLERLEEAGLEPSPDADRATLARRIFFDLTGLPPKAEDVEVFVKDKSPEAVGKLVDRLLASPQFGERWGRHWLDVARYAESTGMERNNTFPQAWRYRDYVIAAYNEDKPFNRFLKEQIAGDLLEEKNDSNIVATGFLAMGPKSLNERDKEIFNMDIVDEQIEVVGRSTMALTINCARCHDHKFDPVSQEDYYALAGIFTSSKTHYGTKSGNGNRQVSTLMPVGEDAEKRKAALASYNKEVAAITRKVQTAKKKLANLKKKAKGSQTPEMKEVQSEMTVMNKELAALKKNRPPSPQQAMGVSDLPAPKDTQLRIRGDVKSKGKVVPRGFLTVTKSDSDPKMPADSSGRLQLAQWIASPENPLTARVYVNRVWLHLFGQGIVRTVDNFGIQGEQPSHPELLDHLAIKFVEEGWSTKKLIRYIVTSRAYQMASTHQDAAYEKDPDNRLVWRMNPRRLDAESIRDAILMASGDLTLEPLKSSIVAEIGDVNIGQNAGQLAKLTGYRAPHRSVYLPIVRNVLPEILQAFDFAEPSILVGQRDVTNVPTQALYLMNSEFVLGQAERIA